MVSSLGLYKYQRTTYFTDSPSPMYCTIRSTAYLRSSMVGITERLCLLDGNVGTSVAEFECGCAWVWRGCDEVVDVVIAGSWDTRSRDTVLEIKNFSYGDGIQLYADTPKWSVRAT